MELHYRNILAAVADTPWAITREKLHAILAFLSIKARGGDIEPQAVGLVLGGGGAAELQRVGPVGVIPIHGTIAHRAGGLRESSGGTSTERISRLLHAALADDSVQSIVLDVNSPGGAVGGVQELADEIHAARAQKRIVAVANAEAGSAAYWLATQASEIAVTPSGRVGSIGVFTAHEDLSKALESEGVKVTLVHAGKFKVEGNPFEPLGDDARAAIQERVDAYYDMFVRAIARGRGVTPAAVRSGFGEGRMVLAHRAVELGMADHVATMAETLSRLTRSKQGGTMPRAESDNEKETASALRDLATHLRSHTGGTR